MAKTITAKQLRTSLPEVVRRIAQGETFTVVYRSRPAFQMVPVDASVGAGPPALDEEPLYGAPAVGESTDGRTSHEHDDVLYGGRRSR
jgi:antitoxin (DNA-binding transcriptional repressor) of toxin-antitoxin stability system